MNVVGQEPSVAGTVANKLTWEWRGPRFEATLQASLCELSGDRFLNRKSCSRPMKNGNCRRRYRNEIGLSVTKKGLQETLRQ